MSKYTGSIEEAAYHEAAHVVACMRVQVPNNFAKVSIQPYLDAKNGDWVHPRPVPLTETHRNSYNGFLDDAFICLAAPALSEYQHGKYDETIYAQDIADALYFVKLSSQYKKLEHNTLPPFEEAWERAQNFVRRPSQQKRVKKVTQELLKRITLDYFQTRSIFSE